MGVLVIGLESDQAHWVHRAMQSWSACECSCTIIRVGKTKERWTLRRSEVAAKMRSEFSAERAPAGVSTELAVAQAPHHDTAPTPSLSTATQPLVAASDTGRTITKPLSPVEVMP
jgi:altronate dehydratase